MAVKVGRSDQAQAAAVAHSGLAGGRGAGHRCGARRGRGHPLPRPRRAARDGRAGRGRPPDRPAGRSRPDRRRDRVDRRGVADRRPRAADRARPAADPGVGAGRHPRGAADDGLHRQPARPVGRRRPRRPPTARAFEAMAASGAYDVLVLVHDFPYRSLPSEVATANEVTGALLAATAERPAILPVYVSLTSGEPPPETKALLDERRWRCAAPARRASRRSGRSPRSPAGRRRHERAGRARPWRAGWPALGRGPDVVRRRPEPDRGRPRASRGPVRAREPGAAWRAAGIAVTEAIAVPDAATAVAAARRIGRPVALKLDAAGLTHKSDVGGRRARAPRRRRGLRRGA